MNCIDENLVEVLNAMGRGLLDFCKSAFPQLVAAFLGAGFAFYFNWRNEESKKRAVEIERLSRCSYDCFLLLRNLNIFWRNFNILLEKSLKGGGSIKLPLLAMDLDISNFDFLHRNSGKFYDNLQQLKIEINIFYVLAQNAVEDPVAYQGEICSNYWFCLAKLQATMENLERYSAKFYKRHFLTDEMKIDFKNIESEYRCFCSAKSNIPGVDKIVEDVKNIKKDWRLEF